jgi:DNA replication protein DnaC
MSSNPLPQVTIYTDGGCSPNPGLGGWAAIITATLNGQAIEREIKGAVEHANNQRMELMSVAEALESLKQPCTVELFADSQYVVKGKYELYTAQKHVVGAIARGFQSRDSILLVGSMGSGKTAMGGTAAIAIASSVVEALRNQVQDNQVILIVAPPHLLEKWKRELHSIARNIYVQRLDRHEERSNSTESKGFAGILQYRTTYVCKHI